MSGEQTDWREAVGKVAWEIARDDFAAASLAALRRLDPEQPDGAAFWLLVARHAPAAFDDERAARALAIVVRGMAVMHPFHRPSAGRRSVGAALGEAGVSEARLLRLLRTGRNELPGEARRLARLMASKGDEGRFDWSAIFDLAFWPDGERLRTRIAKDYFRATYQSGQRKGAAA